MGVEDLDEKNIKYSIINLKDGKNKIDKINLKENLFIKMASIIYFIFMRLSDELMELDMKIGENKHFLSYPYGNEDVLVILVDKNSDYVFIKQNIKKILGR